MIRQTITMEFPSPYQTVDVDISGMHANNVAVAGVHDDGTREELLTVAGDSTVHALAVAIRQLHGQGHTHVAQLVYTGVFLERWATLRTGDPPALDEVVEMPDGHGF